TVVTEAEGEKFITRGTVVLKQGWREVEPPTREARRAASEESKDSGPKDGDAKRASEEDDEEGLELPPLKANDPADVLKAEAVAHGAARVRAGCVHGGSARDGLGVGRADRGL